MACAQPYTNGHYFAYGIYHPWSTFVKTISTPKSPKEPDFARGEKACRNDVEREFGVLQARWDILRPCKNMEFEHNVIMHNKIVENEHGGSNQLGGWDFRGL
jgi:hypothetical protein